MESEEKKTSRVVKDYRDLDVFKAAYRHAMMIFRLSASWPKEERYSLIDQLRRSSRSITSNLAEAWRKRRYENAFILKLTDSQAEASETQVWLMYAKDCCYLDTAAFDELTAAYELINGQLERMIQTATKWCS